MFLNTKSQQIWQSYSTSIYRTQSNVIIAMRRKQNANRTPKIKITANGIRGRSFLRRQINQVYNINSSMAGYVSDVVKKTTSTLYSSSVSVSLWCVLKLLSASKALEHVTGVDRGRKHKIPEKTNEPLTSNDDKPKKQAEKRKKSPPTTKPEVSDAEVQLSKPVEQLIEETLADEFSKLQKQTVQSKAAVQQKAKKGKPPQKTFDSHRCTKKLQIPEETEADISPDEGSSKATNNQIKTDQTENSPQLEGKDSDVVSSTGVDFSLVPTAENVAKRQKKRRSKEKQDIREEEKQPDKTGTTNQKVEWSKESKDKGEKKSSPVKQESGDFVPGLVKELKDKLENLPKATLTEQHSKKNKETKVLDTHKEIVNSLQQILEQSGKKVSKTESEPNLGARPKQNKKFPSQTSLHSKTKQDVSEVNAQNKNKPEKPYVPLLVTPSLSYSACLKNQSATKLESEQICDSIVAEGTQKFEGASRESAPDDLQEQRTEESEGVDKAQNLIQEAITFEGGDVFEGNFKGEATGGPRSKKDSLNFITEEIKFNSQGKKLETVEDRDRDLKIVEGTNHKQVTSDFLAVEKATGGDCSQIGDHTKSASFIEGGPKSTSENSFEESETAGERHLLARPDEISTGDLLGVTLDEKLSSTVESGAEEGEIQAGDLLSDTVGVGSEVVEESIKLSGSIAVLGQEVIINNFEEGKRPVEEFILQVEKSALFEEALTHVTEEGIIPKQATSRKQDLRVEFKEFNSCKHQTDSSAEPQATTNMYIDEQIRVLTLNDNEHQDSTLYRIEKNWVIQFRLGPSLLGRKVHLYTNYPEHSNVDFKRTRYQLLKWHQDEGCKNADDTASYAEVISKISGSFHFYFVYDDADTSGPHGSGFFLVDPILRYGYNEELPLDSIQCQTVLAKMLGPFSSWESKLRVAKESGYNMIHFTPIQALGDSNSSYSLSEHLKLNPIFYDGPKVTFHDVEIFMGKMRTEWKMTSICDIVLNHTANESEWLRDHPECTYNCKNCPYMRPAYLLDAALHQFSLEVKAGLYEHKGIPVQVSEEDHLNAIRYTLHSDVLPKINIHEMYICDANKLTAEFLNLARNKVSPMPEHRAEVEELKLIQDPEYTRLGCDVDMPLALRIYNVYRSDCFDEESRLKRCSEEFKKKLDELNKVAMEEINYHLNAAVENCVAGMRYFRVQQDGPKIKDVSVKNPLVFRYFTDFGTPKSVKEHEEIMYSDNGKYLMAHNGWVMNADPLRNFAAEDSNVYVRRELIAWGDSVKLRYGDQPEDCPFLWNHMRQYVEQTAKIFDGVRLDNCHSTPIPVAEYLLDCARKVRPDLYVVAELFTNSDQKDNIFVNRLGITSLIREGMSAWDSHELGRLVYRYGGYPVGAFYQPNIRPLVPSIAHALFLDLTHDNPSPIEKRSVYDLLPSSALVNMACCASGSNRGYDELVPHHIHVVDETRQYAEWADTFDQAALNPRYVTRKSGIISAKKALNDLHFRLGMDGFNQVFVDQMDTDIVAVTRHCPRTHESVILVAFTAFSHPSKDSLSFQRDIKPLRVEGVLDEVILEASVKHKDDQTGSYKFAKDSRWINGYLDYEVHLKEHLQLKDSDVFDEGQSGDKNYFQLNFKNFKPGSIVAIKVSLHRDVQDSIGRIRDFITTFNTNRELRHIINELTLADMNKILYRCDPEERDEGKGFGVYNIPNFGPLVYCGLQGFISLLTNIRPQNDLGHPMCSNLRDGNWMIDYIWQRLKADERTQRLGQWLEENTRHLKAIPRYLVPCYFDIVVTGVYIQMIERCYELMSEFVKFGSTFVKALALGSVQFGGVVKSSPLPTLSPSLAPPLPPVRRTESGETHQACVTLSAGLPHFTVGYTRNWGRDTFIALRGLFILTGRHQEARYHILGYAGCLRHGLIPNLLDGGKNARYNARDAVWWWLYSIQSYVEEVPNGVYILNDKVSRLFPTDDSAPREPGAVDQPLYEVMQEALHVHFQGMAFRERNAGRQIDEQMSDKGFNNQIGIHPETGFVFGGNNANCGTWMDKMGSSEKAGNKGKPASPRDGSAIELVALCKSVVSWLNHLYNHGHYPYDGVERTHKSGSVTKWTFKQWAEKIQNNFEKCFWIDVEPIRGEIRPDLINKRGIYKDCYGSSNEYTDFQLRCNFPMAMVIAPELFNPKHAWTALKMAEKYLLGPLGMKTLDPEDWAYCGDYDNSNDSSDAKVARGFNYHQGPEWVWPIGYFLRAKLYFAAENKDLRKTLSNTKVVLSRHFTELQTSIWRGLPELTNSSGAYCNDSSRTQAWSMSSILEVLDDLKKIESNQPIY